MANFIVVVDADIERRSRFLKAVEPLLPLVDGLINGTCSKGDFCALWAAGAQAPISQVADDEGAAVIWGEPIAGPGSKRVNARELKQLWPRDISHRATVFDGFFAAVVYQRDVGIIIGADLVGLFPLYYFARGEVLLVGSSPELFRHHPVFRLELSPQGLVGILLTMHIVDGHTLLRGVKRLAAGHVLTWNERSGPQEREVYKVPVSDRYFDLPFAAHVDLLDRALEQTMTRQLPANERTGLLLSGGLDSRMLGGYLKRIGMTRTAALTYGLPSDIEMKCAIQVARTLCLEHRAANIPDDQYPVYAGLQARWEHVANGFNSVMQWGGHTHLRKLGPRVVTGLMMDPVVGGSHITWAYSSQSDKWSFDTFFARINRYGIQIDVLKRLLRREAFGDLVEETVARIKKAYESFAELESQRAWCFDLYHRQRFHVGGDAWAFSFGAWPVLPVLDRELLESVGGMPAATLIDRRAQKELLCNRFPELAALPLDRNSHNTIALKPTLPSWVKYRLREHLRDRLDPVRDWLPVIRRPKAEDRYYYRTYDLNGPGWRAVRHLAEPHRERVLHLFDKKSLGTLLPPSHVPLQLQDEIIDSSGLKSMLGFLLWSQDHLN